MRALEKTFTEAERGAPARGTCARDDFSEPRQESLDVWVICLELFRASCEEEEVMGGMEGCGRAGERQRHDGRRMARDTRGAMRKKKEFGWKERITLGIGRTEGERVHELRGNGEEK